MGDVDAAARTIVTAFHKENPDYIVIPEILEMVYRQMVRHIANAMEEGETPA